MIQSLPVPTLYGTILVTWFVNVFRFVVNIMCLLLKLIEAIFTVSI